MKSKNSNSAIVCFSRTGHSARLARKLEDETGDLIILLDADRYGSGLFGFMRAGYDSFRNASVLQSDFVDHVSRFDRLILCGPVWTSYPAAPLRAVLRLQSRKSTEVALFITSATQSSGIKAIEVAERDLGRALVASDVLTNDREGTPDETRTIQRFVTQLQHATHLEVVS